MGSYDTELLLAQDSTPKPKFRLRKDSLRAKLHESPLRSKNGRSTEISALDYERLYKFAKQIPSFSKQTSR